MRAAEQTNLVLTYKRLNFEFSDGAKSRLLFRLAGMRAPEVRTICVIVDCSDSYDKAIQDISTLRRTISRWPSDWVVHFFQLSSPDLLATQNIAEFCKGEDRVERYFERESNLTPSQCCGSFLRPCIESIAAIGLTEDNPSAMVVFVLGDGQFTDFLPVTLPNWIKLVVISTVSNTNGPSHLACMQWGTKPLLQFINGYVPLFVRKVPLIVKGFPAGARFFSVDDCNLQQWPKPGESILDTQLAVPSFLIDCEPEQAIDLSWWIRSKGEFVRLPAPVACDVSDERNICEVVNAGLRNMVQKQSFQVLFESQTGSHNHRDVQLFFEAAESAAKMRNKWSRTDASSRFDELVRSFGGTQEVYMDAVLIVGARTEGSPEPERVIALGLCKSMDLQMRKGDCLGRFTVLHPFRMSFDPERRRWHLSVDGQLDLELGASSQLIELPITYASQDVSVLFSKPERH